MNLILNLNESKELNKELQGLLNQYLSTVTKEYVSEYIEKHFSDKTKSLNEIIDSEFKSFKTNLDTKFNYVLKYSQEEMIRFIIQSMFSELFQQILHSNEIKKIMEEEVRKVTNDALDKKYKMLIEAQIKECFNEFSFTLNVNKNDD